MATTTVGTLGDDKIVLGSGDDVVDGGAGNDTINGGAGADTLDGGSGLDRLFGGSGADILIYKAFENQWKTGTEYLSGTEDGAITSPILGFTGYDKYDGGNGNASGGAAERDTLQIWLNPDQLANSAIMAEIAQAKIWVEAQKNANTGQAGTATFTFTTINLTITQVEKIEIRNQYGNTDYTVLAPSAPDLVAASDSGNSSTDNNTNVNTPTVTGNGAEAGATVRLYDSDGTTVLGTATADASGNWSITSSALTNGVHNLTVKQTDIAGNSSSASSGLSVSSRQAPPLATM